MTWNLKIFKNWKILIGAGVLLIILLSKINRKSNNKSSTTLLPRIFWIWILLLQTYQPNKINFHLIIFLIINNKIFTYLQSKTFKMPLKWSSQILWIYTIKIRITVKKSSKINAINNFNKNKIWISWDKIKFNSNKWIIKINKKINNKYITILI